MLRESQLVISRTSSGDWEGEVYVSDADEYTERTPPEVPGGTDEIAEFLSENQDEAVGIVNWVAGGMLLFLNTADGIFIPVGWRDADAPSYSECLCTASGIADSGHDVLHPRHLGYREALEEILLYNDSTDEWMLPTDNSIQLDETSVTNELYSMWRGTDYVPTDAPVKSVPATVHPLGSDAFTVYPPSKNTEPTESKGHFVLDEETRNVDIVDALVVDIPETSIEDVRLFDGEEIGGDLLNRDVFLFTPEGFKSLFDGEATAMRGFSNGKYKAEDGHTTAFEVGEEITREFEGVPTLTESHDEFIRFLRKLQLLKGEL